MNFDHWVATLLAPLAFWVLLNGLDDLVIDFAALAGRTMPRGRLEVQWDARAIGAGLEEEIADWLDYTPEEKLAVLDRIAQRKAETEAQARRTQ